MIDLRGVSKTVLSGGRPLTILHPLDLVVPGGQLLSVVGPSGSGKSTLLGLIAGLDAPTTGAILVDGVDITTLDEDRRRSSSRAAKTRPRKSSSIASPCRSRNSALFI